MSTPTPLPDTTLRKAIILLSFLAVGAVLYLAQVLKTLDAYANVVPTAASGTMPTGEAGAGVDEGQAGSPEAKQ